MKRFFISLVQWVLVIAVIIALWYGAKYIPEFGIMPLGLILLFAISFSFVVVYTFKVLRFKPFNCLKCLTAWTALVLAYTHGYEHYILVFFTGAFIGAVFDAFKDRWL